MRSVRLALGGEGRVMCPQPVAGRGTGKVPPKEIQATVLWKEDRKDANNPDTGSQAASLDVAPCLCSLQN